MKKINLLTLKIWGLFFGAILASSLLQAECNCQKCKKACDSKACACKNCACKSCQVDNKDAKKSLEVKENEKMTGVIGPRWTYAIMVKNDTKNEIRVMVDGGDVNGFTKIAPGEEKLMNSRGVVAEDGKKGIYWINGDNRYETEKYSRLDCVVIHDGNKYDATAMDKVVVKGTWTANEPNEYKGQEAKEKKTK